MACGFEAVYAAEAGAQVAVREVGVGEGAFAGGGGGGEKGVAGSVGFQEEGWGEVEGSTCQGMLLGCGFGSMWEG